MADCIRCGAHLSFNEIGAHKKLICRASTQFLCRDCLAEKLQVPTAVIDKKIQQFKQQGCSLFV